MTLRELYEFAIKRGMELDPRGPEELRKWLDDLRERYEGLTGRERELFDTERLENPFGDTRIICGDPDTEITRAVLGIDIDAGEILLAEALRRRGEEVNAVIGHHTSGLGHAMASAEDTMWVQVHMMERVGVPRSRAESLVREDMKGRPRGSNYRIPQVAEALGIPLMTIHTPCDLHVYQYVYELLEERRPETVGDLVELICEWPEVQWLMERGTGPQIASGDARNHLGKTHVHFVGGWNPSLTAMEAMCEAGVETFLLMATSAQLNEVASKYRANLVVAPHYPADNVGINLFLDQVCARSPIEIIEASNFVRVERS